MKNNRLNLQRLKEACRHLQAEDFVYYCVYYCNEIFNDGLLAPCLEALKTETSERNLNAFGLDKAERKPWNISFAQRLFSGCLKQYFEKVLSPEDLQKIEINSELM